MVSAIFRETKCPNCDSEKIWKDSSRHLEDHRIQRYVCRSCGLRFSAPSSRHKTGFPIRGEEVNIPSFPGYSCQVGASEVGVKNLVKVESRIEEKPAGGTTNASDVQGKLVDFVFYMKKQGFAETTITTRFRLLKLMVKRGADLYDAESVKETIARQTWSSGRKANAVDAYTSFLRMIGSKWVPPRYKKTQRYPFIPEERELDQLIGGCSKRISTFLQLLKETGIRAGEAWNLKWIDVDFVNRTVRVTPEKGSNPRMLRLSDKATSMLSSMPRDSEVVFGGGILRYHAESFRRQRTRLAKKLENPRLLHITFHTFRHWKATMEYHKTKDILHVMQVLGHKSINNTLIYTHLIPFKDDEYVSKVAKTVQDACMLIDNGFEYVCDVEDVKVFRKRK